MKESVESSPKRFDLGDNEIIRARLDMIQSTVREMQDQHPAIVSFLMFGSMVKGYATEKSDIDGRLIIDTDIASESSAQPVEVEIFWAPISDNDEKTINSIGARLRPNDKDLYEKWVRDCFKKRLPESNAEQMKHIEAIPISHEVIDLMVKFWAESLQKSVKGKDDKNIRASEYLSQLFFLDIGNHGMKEYRSYLIKKLFSHGSIGHEMWNKIIGFTEIMERKVQYAEEEGVLPDALDTGIFTKVRYPRTLDEAKVVYG